MTFELSDRIKGLQPSAIREILKFTADPTVISFAAGNPAPEAFPVEMIRKISSDIFEQEPINALQYSISEGYTPLRDYLKRELLKKGVFDKDRDDIIITAGAQQVMELVTKVLCNEGRAVICEEPSFIGSLNSFRSYNARLAGVPMDLEGVIPEKLEDTLRRNIGAAFIYLIPNFQNPTGNTMSLKRRQTVLEIAARHNIPILEDDPYGDLRFAGVDIPTIKSLDLNNSERRVIYAGSFSKTLAPGLRVGYMCAPKELVQKAVAALQVSTVHSNIWAQMLTYRFLTEVNYEEHLENLQCIYKRKCNLMLNSLRFSMPLSISFTEPEGGLFIWGMLPNGSDAAAFCKKAVENKVATVPGSAFLANEKAVSRCFRLNFSTPTDAQIERGTEILSKVANSMF